MAGEHLSPAQLAAREGVSLATVYAWNYQRTGPRYFRTGTSPGGRVRYRLEDVLEWERAQTVTQEREVARGA